MNILLTGASGFVGSHILSHFLKNTDAYVTCICSWKHKGEPYRIINDENYQNNKDRVTMITHDLVSPLTPRLLEQVKDCTHIVHIASESHVDRSITDPTPFVLNNVSLSLNMLEVARIIKPSLYLSFSTDEVYGQCPLGYKHKEWDSTIPSNPYAASKAAQDALGISFWRSYEVPVILTQTMNIFGQRQDREKYIPLCINKILKGELLSIHSYPDKKRAGSRFYIHSRNVADAILHILNTVKPPLYPDVDRPERFNIVGEVEIDNLSLAQKIATIIGKPLKYEMVDFHSSRPGHDCRYALDGLKLEKYGWKPKVSFEKSLADTVYWYIKNEFNN